MGPDKKRAIRTSIFLAILFNGLVPYAAYVLLKPHIGSITALVIATLFPLVENVYQLSKNRRLDAFGILMLSVFVVSIVLAAAGGDERVILARESIVTLVVGLWFLGSLLFKRPLMFYLALRFTVSTQPDERKAFADKWQYPYFRRVLRMMTFGWGGVLTLEAVIRTILVYSLTTERFLIVSNPVFYTFVGALIVWTIRYRRRSKVELERLTSFRGMAN